MNPFKRDFLSPCSSLNLGFSQTQAKKRGEDLAVLSPEKLTKKD
jgi:hypothetical protein